MKRKKLLSVVLAGVMVFSLTACGGNGNSTEGGSTSGSAGSATSSAASKTSSASTGSTSSTASSSTSTADATPVSGGQLIIGDGTQSNGDIYPYWTNNASDYAVYQLTTGCSTIEIDKAGKFVVNPQVVKEKNDVKNDDGTVTTTFKLQEGLKWSNGEPITAKDYVFRILYFSSPVIVEIGATDNTAGSDFDGFTEYNEGKTKVFKGVRLLGDYEFAVTLAKEKLPNY